MDKFLESKEIDIRTEGRSLFLKGKGNGKKAVCVFNWGLGKYEFKKVVPGAKIELSGRWNKRGSTADTDLFVDCIVAAD